MPQNAIGSTIGVKGGAGAPCNIDTAGLLMTSVGGLKSTLNVTVAAAIKATPGRIAKITVLVAPTTSGALTVNDCATTGAATTANQIFSSAFGAVTAGLVITLDFPCLVGITISAVGGGSPQYAVSWT